MRYLEVTEVQFKKLGYLEKFIAFLACFPAIPRYFLDTILSSIKLR